jgi:hypothetical protein
MTEEQLAAMHGLLAEYHRKLAKESVLDVTLTLGNASLMRPC